MFIGEKCSQKFLVNVSTPQGFILVPTIFLLYINYINNDTVHNIAIYAYSSTFSSTYNWVSDLWQQLELVS